jgi:hypothetical protein
MDANAGPIVEKAVVQTYWNLKLRSDGIVWLARRHVPYPSIQSVHTSYDEFLAAVDDWLLERRIRLGKIGTRTRLPMAWLTDMRDAPDMRNDPTFEAVVKERRPALLERSAALAILVNTSAGQMQLNRITNTKDAVLGVFSDPDEIVAWLHTRMRELFGRPT